MVSLPIDDLEESAFLTELLSRQLLISSGVPGIYGCGPVFDDVLTAVDHWIGRAGAVDSPEHLRFPPLLPRHHLELHGYLASFPHLAGSVFAFTGGEIEAARQAKIATRHEPWDEFQTMTDIVLTPAACQAAYPAIAQRGSLPAAGAILDLGGAWVFRHEPSGDPTRMQSFRMREMVRLGQPEVVRAWRDGWRDRSPELLLSLGLDTSADAASDPFFGRSGRMLAASQRGQELKFELLLQIVGTELTAVASFNYHHEFFAAQHSLTNADGSVAHSACVGFGLERITLALLRAHGSEPAQWPTRVRKELWP